MFKTIGYGLLVAMTAVAFVAGSATSSEAAKKKAKAAAAPQPVVAMCNFFESKPVCAMKGKQKFTYNSACFAGKDGAKVTSAKACPTKVAKKGKGKKVAKKKKPAKAS